VLGWVFSSPAASAVTLMILLYFVLVLEFISDVLLLIWLACHDVYGFKVIDLRW
jgi:hypothetical protein